MAIERFFLSLAVGTLAVATSVCAGPMAASSLQPGYYTLTGAACGNKNATGPGCTKATIGCMKIAAEQAGGLKLQIFSPQESGHVCGINGKAALDAGKIVYRDKDFKGHDWLLELTQGAGDTVAFRYVNPPEGRAPFCGEHARLDGVVFKAVKQLIAEKTCFEG